MRALLQAIVSVVRSWLNCVRGQLDGPRLEEQRRGDRERKTSQEEDHAGLHTDHAQARDETHATVNLPGPEPRASTDVLASDPSSSASTTESTTGTPPVHDSGHDMGDGREHTDGQGDACDDIESGMHDAEGKNGGGEGAQPGPMIPPLHESIDRGGKESHEPAVEATKSGVTGQIAEVAATEEPDDLAGEARDETKASAGETEILSDTEVVDSVVMENDGTDGESDLETERSADEVKPEADGSRAVPSTSTLEKERRRRSQYRGPRGGLPPSRKSSQSRTAEKNGHALSARNRPPALEVRVRVLFRHGGDCIVSLLPKRLPGLPEELVASSHAGDVELQVLQDDWYQDVYPDNLADLLRAGFVWEDPDTAQEWLLSGREVFVLAHGTTHRGFVSCSRLTLGRDHVVLCTAGRLSAVGDALRAAGCAGWTQLGEDDGAPSGWRVLREIRPQQPVPLSRDDDILNVLRPLPEIDIALEGGIRLAYNSWLLGYPPAIRIYGYCGGEHAEPVMIDGNEAAGSEHEGYTTPGWDAEGKHQVSCSGINKSYSVVRSETNSTYRPAYFSSLRGAGGENRDFEFCGPLVRPVAIDAKLAQRRVVQVPHTNPVLLGSCPGEVYFAHRRMEVRGAQCLELPPFDPLWALPVQPLRCDKRTNRIVLVGTPTAESDNACRQPLKDPRGLEQWCQLVLDASRKGLAIEPASPAAHRLWREYKQHARTLWRKLR